MSWFDLSEDERREFRDGDVGKALLAEIADQIQSTKDEVISTMCDESETAPNHARRLAGRVDGMEVIKNIIMRDK